ncbi:MAG TPA: hypothetical protein VIN67_09240 [Desulfobaccales bacterium]
MKKAVLLSIALLLALCLAGCSSKPQEFKSEAGRFSIMTPVALQEETQPLETEAGKISLHLFAAQEGFTGYFVSYCDYPPEFVKKKEPEQMLDGARDGATKSAKGKLVSDTKISLAGHPGLEVVIDAREPQGPNGLIKGRLFMVGNRLYQVMVVAPKSRTDDQATDSFLQSFKLLAP